MFDLVLGLRQTVKGRAQDEAKIAASQPLFRVFCGFGGLCNGYGMSNHGFTHV
jgi:hypothetical protein